MKRIVVALLKTIGVVVAYCGFIYLIANVTLFAKAFIVALGMVGVALLFWMFYRIKP